MTRRSACASLGAVALAHGALPARADVPAWQTWKAAFLAASGRVTDDLQNGISHSEGQGYALLLAQAHGDHEAFDRIESWTRTHLAVRSDALMAWRWRPEAGTADPQTATDGDLFRAWALLRAARDSGREAYRPEALRIARDIAALCLVPDPRAPSERLLAPFANPEGDGRAVLLNPSYYMSRALRELGEAAGLPVLIRAADHGERLLSEIGTTDWLPDWLAVTADGAVTARGYFGGLGYDALRIALYLVWSGRAEHEAAQAARRILVHALPGLPQGHVPTRVTRDGIVTDASDYPGYRALWQLVAAPAGAPRPDLEPPRNRPQPYYPATLGLLADIAAREGGPWG
ncbi:glycosyl hydrolase family 8 [Roseicyclus sp. F158]|uniref:cellulase n=1 Tax=Tropicimonas omnivorans TaxID=3075590 RepID=A0ABU3DJR9_9RHOB|nr:glycosyl hydrolase family 8 [Roseicyclus sp. F158]MDT0683959.1 glycosyl hydrolase family 8 [Roseicyclus sp. F158]